jgi:ferredoxin
MPPIAESHELWTAQTICDVAILLTWFSCALHIGRAYFERVMGRLSLRISCGTCMDVCPPGAIDVHRTRNAGVRDPRAGGEHGVGIVEKTEVREHAVHPPLGRIAIAEAAARRRSRACPTRPVP